MRRVAVFVVLGLMLIGSSAFGADGDVIVNGGFKGGTVTAACSAPLSGYMRWNSSSSVYEVCNGAVWTAVGGIIGEVKMYAGAAAPSGWLLCDGSAVSRTTYAALFALIGTTYGAGDGSTTFNLPDLRGRAAIGAGQGTGLTLRALGAKSGAETHALTSAENGQHTHTDSGHSHIERFGSGGTLINAQYGYGSCGATSPLTNTLSAATESRCNIIGDPQFYMSSANITTSSVTVNVTNSPTSATQGHNTMMPFAVVNYIIKY